ncbi:hypothetical protein GIB64_01125 [Pseudomonas lactis]|uniref:hypothetical protein n=1 Tax=Pseudomonas TaxID=286 RepID=UPI000BB63515|nr:MULTISPECIES: hypothetical protein [Pseudomonas]MBA5956016.1 hypothetical protein [Pseudomonas lactis]MBJ2210834.1 hypothetical protein [Pseudomonas carnis]PRW77182.1 hypothetical protein C7A12_11625 [Pseudomonas fluorescens]PRW79252.1 hypothetical protein C7A13_12180 [Pseudomonas fluorescens]
MTLIEKPSQLPQAVGAALHAALPGLKVGSHQDFQGDAEKNGVMVTVEGNGPGIRSREGRKAHVLAISLRAMVAPGALAFDACDLASQLMDLVLDNRWNLPPAQCDLPANIVAAPALRTSVETDYDTWTVSFTQTLYLGPTLLDDSTGQPLFACTWDVSNIDDPAQYKPLAE